MTNRRQLAYFAAIGLVILLIALGLAFYTGRLTREMVKDPGYLLWTQGLREYKSEYSIVFSRDRNFLQRLLGKPIETIRPLFPNLHSGATYSEHSYRRKGIQGWITPTDGAKVEDYWIEGGENDWGYCILVVDGRIRNLIFVKG